MALRQYQVCPHCNQLLSEKTLKEHRRLYYDDEREVWVKFSSSTYQTDDHSRTSSPLEVSPPVSMSSVRRSLSQSSIGEQFDVEDPGVCASCRFKYAQYL